MALIAVATLKKKKKDSTMEIPSPLFSISTCPEAEVRTFENLKCVYVCFSSGKIGRSVRSACSLE